LEPSRAFSTRPVYRSLSQGQRSAVSHFKEVWRTKVPPKIKIFLWQLIRNRLPTSEHVAKRRVPSMGFCALCDDHEDCNHIFFACPMARFAWAGVRELLQCDWKPAGAGDFMALSNNVSGPLRRLVWFTFAPLCWTLWINCNKLTIEGKMICNPTDIFYQMSIYMQCWRVLVRQKNRTLLD
jgi:hypothetical protein